MRLEDGTRRAPEARIPRPWLTHSKVIGLSESSFRLWVLLWSYAHHESKTAFPSTARLCKEMGKSERVLYRALAQLEKTGLLTRTRGGRGTTTYTLQDPAACTAQKPRPQ